MIETIKDWNGNCTAYLVWMLCDKDTKSNKQGEYVYVDDLWIHPLQRNKKIKGKKIIRKFIDDIMKQAPTAKYGYWVRKKYKERVKLFTKEQLKNRRRYGRFD